MTTTLGTLERRTAVLAKEARRLYSAPGPATVADWLVLFTDDERDQVETFLATIEPRLGTLPGGSLDLSGITDDELDQLLLWSNLAKEHERASKKQ